MVQRSTPYVYLSNRTLLPYAIKPCIIDKLKEYKILLHILNVHFKLNVFQTENMLGKYMRNVSQKTCFVRETELYNFVNYLIKYI